MMKITILGSGTSQGVPIIACHCPTCESHDPKDKRLRTSALIETDSAIFSIDAGPDFRQQMLREHVSHLDAILITHEHKDHIGGLDDVRPFNFNQKFSMPIYASPSAQEEIKREYSYAFSKKLYPGAPTFDLRTIDDSPFYLGNNLITPIKLVHYTLTSFGFRIDNFAYISDFNKIPDDSFEKLIGVQYLIIEALRHEEHYSHINLRQALDIIERLNVKKAWLTHISHNMGLASEINPTLPLNVKLAYDGEKILI